LIIDENRLQSTQISDWGKGSPSNTNQSWLWDKSQNDLEWHLKIAVQQLSPSNLTELERICREEWEKLPKYRCALLVASYPRKLETVITAKGVSTKF
jgi:hypothetical protein